MNSCSEVLKLSQISQIIIVFKHYLVCGMIPPTSGDAEIDGKLLSEKLPEIRKELGVCPQHDILFPKMTVREHLFMFSK